MPEKSSKPKLLVLASTYPRWRDDPEPGFVHELAKRLTEKYEVLVIGPHAAGALTEEWLDGVRVMRYRYAPASWESLVNDGGIVVNLRKQRWKWLLVPFFVFGLFWRARRVAKNWQPDVVHAHWLIPQGMVAAIIGSGRDKVPFLVTSHGADLFALKAWPLPAWKRFVARRAALVTVVSTAMRTAMVHIGISESKIRVRPMGVDLESLFTPDPAVLRSQDEILFVGRLVEKKGLHHLIDALPQVIAACPSACLTIAGFGPEEAILRKQVEQLQLADKVCFLGALKQNELPPLYRRAAVFVAPFIVAANGDAEGLGLVVVEAVGCHCPVLVGDVPAVHDIVGTQKDAVVLPTDTAALASAVVSILNSPESAAGHAVKLRRDILGRMSWSAVSADYAALLDGCRNENPRA